MEKIAFKTSRNAYACIPLDQILYLKSDNSYTELVTVKAKIYTLTQALKSFESNPRLNAFIRVNSCVIINPMFLEEFKMGKMPNVLLTNGEEFIPSKNYFGDLEQYILQHMG